MQTFEKATDLIRRFKGEQYIHGFGVLSQAGGVAAALGQRAVLVRDAFPGSETHVETIAGSLAAAGVKLAGILDGAAPNAPREDLGRITESFKELRPDVIVSLGAGAPLTPPRPPRFCALWAAPSTITSGLAW